MAAEPADPVETVHRDLLHEPGLTPRHREVAAQLGLGASYALPLTAERVGTARHGGLVLRRARRAHRPASAAWWACICGSPPNTSPAASTWAGPAA